MMAPERLDMVKCDTDLFYGMLFEKLFLFLLAVDATEELLDLDFA